MILDTRTMISTEREKKACWVWIQPDRLVVAFDPIDTHTRIEFKAADEAQRSERLADLQARGFQINHKG